MDCLDLDSNSGFGFELFFESLGLEFGMIAFKSINMFASKRLNLFVFFIVAKL